MMIIYPLSLIPISLLMKFNKIFDILNYICDWKKKRVRNFSSFYLKLDNFNSSTYIQKVLIYSNNFQEQTSHMLMFILIIEM